MKQVTILTTVLFVCFLQANAQKEVKQVSNQTNQPYKVQATKISIGNQAYAQQVLWAWKYYDDNVVDKAADLFADDVVATLPDGTLIKGKDNFLKAMRDYRNSLASSVCEIAACTTLKTPDDPEHEVVTIWGTETDTNKDGVVSKVHINEVWFFNKQGKVVEFHQMSAKDSPEKK